MGFYEMIKGAAKVAKEAGNIDLYSKILEFQAIAMDLQHENDQLKNEIRELKNNLEIQEKLKFEDNMYYLIDDENKEGPYCSPCWDQNNKLIRMHEVEIYGVEVTQCPVCIRKK